MKLSKKTILITGGTSGIGMELARQLLQRDNTIIVTGRDIAKLKAAQRTLPGLEAFQSDAGDPAAIVKLYASVVEHFPQVNVLINNAGLMRDLNINAARDLSDVTREIEVNLSGTVRMVQQFLPHLRTQKGALIVNVSSGLAFVPMAMSPVYSATKAAIHSFTQCLRVQVEGTGVTVVELAPPLTETPLYRNEFADLMPGQKGMDVQVLVKAAIAGIEAGKIEIRPGLSAVLKIMSRVAPQFMFKQLAKVGKQDPMRTLRAAT